MKKLLSKDPVQLLSGAQIAVKTLERLGVELCFAYPGGSAVEFHQALADSAIRVVLPRHEQGGAFAAGGYARATGKIGVCMATSGPGATNLLTGIADAWMDSVPVVIITGQVEAGLIGKNAFQETDIIGMSRPIVKHSYLVLDPAEIGATIVAAFALAGSGRPGPVWIDIPKNVQKAVAEFHFDPGMPPGRENARQAVRPEEIAAVKRAIARARRPCIYAGGGVIAAGAAEELRRFAEGYGIPVATSLMGIGAFPETHPLSLKFFGMHGSYCANYAVNECDLLLVFGARFADRSTGDAKTFAAGARIVHIDVDASEINKNVPVDLGIVADLKAVLTALNRTPEPVPHPEWLEMVRRWKKMHPFAYRPEPGRLKAQQVIDALYRRTGGRAIIVPGVGQHQMWAAQYFQYTRPRQLLTSGGLGSMGFGLPAAVGAKLALPEELVINIDGDGSFQMNIQELGTIAAEEIGVKMIILNNRHLGMVAQIEDLFYQGKRGNTDLRTKAEASFPKFAGIANAYGIPARDVYHPAELEAALDEMLASPGPFLLDCHTVYQDHVLPMIPGGKSYREMITG
ncbi:biosynthetic-type acetolactate synthase large subunit [Victivallis sp. Marseille-Q1083]|uniref:biosynthetic-type acetolactate synthase large subunit n=1 Tax=Victivallis sp. Marseille-Q1083 TaxID=2717288 RepID=UPI00158A4B72|nr:biosynthetic-type acetolactate synthase large subunit [Victivallis sp. Marseille-Q1083]